MSKKMVSIFALIVFIAFTFSCGGYTTKKIRVGSGETPGKKHPRITTVLTKSGDLYEFSRRSPAFSFNMR